MEQETFQQETITVKQAQALSIFEPTFPAELDVHVTQEEFGWGFYGSARVPFEFQSGSGHRFGMEQKKGIV